MNGRRQCADVVFYIAPRNIDTDAITSKFIQKEVEEILAPVIGVLGVAGALIPGVGEVVAAGAAFAAAGLDLANQNTEIGIDFQPVDQFVHAINGELLCILYYIHEQGLEDYRKNLFPEIFRL